MVAAAENAGKLAVDAAVVKADSEIQELRRQAEEQAKALAEELSVEAAKKKAALRADAQAKLEKAAALVVERIVNS